MAEIKKYAGENALPLALVEIGTKLANKAGRDELPEADYTLAEKIKLANIEAGANKYTLPPAKVDALGGVIVGDGLGVTEGGKLYVTGDSTVNWAGIPDKPETYPPTAHSQGANTITGLAAVATSGAYGDLSGTPNIPTNNSQLSNGAGYTTAPDVQTLIAAAISAVYKPAGSATFSTLPALAASILGYVFDVKDAFITTADFIEGAGHSYTAGTNVVCVESSGTYKWDVLAGFVDLTSYLKVTSLVEFTTEEIHAMCAAAFGD